MNKNTDEEENYGVWMIPQETMNNRKKKELEVVNV